MAYRLTNSGLGRVVNVAKLSAWKCRKVPCPFKMWNYELQLDFDVVPPQQVIEYYPTAGDVARDVKWLRAIQGELKWRQRRRDSPDL